MMASTTRLNMTNIVPLFRIEGNSTDILIARNSWQRLRKIVVYLESYVLNARLIPP